MRIYEKVELRDINRRFVTNLRCIFGLVVLVKKLDVGFDNRIRVLVHAEGRICPECETWTHGNVGTLIHSVEH